MAILEYKYGDVAKANAAIEEARLYDQSANTKFVYAMITQGKPIYIEVKDGKVVFSTDN